MTGKTRWFLLSVLALDVVVAVAFVVGLPGELGAQSVDPASVATGAAAVAAAGSGEQDPSMSPWTREALDLLGKRLQERTEELDRRESQLDELLRGSEVLRLAGEAAPEPAGEPTAAAPAEEEASQPGESFLRLQRAYENMEPATAATALAELAERDKDAVVALLLGWPPRTSGAILDALTTVKPVLAADLSYEIWKLDGKKRPAAAD